MTSFKERIKQSYNCRRILSAFIYPVIWFLLKAEWLLQKISGFFINKTITVFEGQKSLEPKVDRLTAKHLTPCRLTDYLHQRIRKRDINLQASFASAVFLRTNYSFGLELPEMKLNEKPAGKKFAVALGLCTPETFLEDIPFSKVELIAGSVIKPVDEYSVRGVFVVKSEYDILELATGRSFNGREQLDAHIAALLKNGFFRKDKWMVEQLIAGKDGGIPLDVKFNVFYGKVGWIEVIDRYPDEKFHIIDGSGNRILSEVNKSAEQFVSEGVTKEEMALAEQVSLQIPAPYIRIDFLRAPDGLCFCEFTPRTGALGFHNRKRDHKYGKMFHDAEARLAADLIAGKPFNVFNETTT